MLEQKPLRILEIGEFCLFKRNRPRETTFVFTGDNPRHLADVEYTPFGPAMLPRMLRSLKRGDWDIVFCFPRPRPLLDPRRVFAGLPAALARALFRFRTLGTYMASSRYPTPLVVLDYNDPSTVPRSALKLLDRSIAYFKRELPLDSGQGIVRRGAPISDAQASYLLEFFSAQRRQAPADFYWRFGRYRSFGAGEAAGKIG